MDLSLLLCGSKEVHYPPGAIFDTSCTPIYRGCTFQAPTKITYAYSYGAGFVDPQHPQTTFPDVEMISAPELEVEKSDDENVHTLNSLRLSPRDSHTSAEEEPDAAVSMPLTPAEISNKRARTPAAEVRLFLATQPEVSPGGVETDLVPPVKDRHYDEHSRCPSPPYIPSSHRYHPDSDDERDDAIVSMQLASSGFSSSDGVMSPSPQPVLLGLGGLEEDEEIFDCPGSPPYVPESPMLAPSSGIGDVLAEEPFDSPPPLGDHAQFDGDSTGFLKWLDGVVHAKGRVPSFINGLELPLEDQKSLSQWLDQYRGWRTTVQCPDPPFKPLKEASKSKPGRLTSGMRPHRHRVTRGDRHTDRAKPKRIGPHGSTRQDVNKVVVTGQRSALLDRILQKCNAEGVELSEALCLFQGRLSGMCAKLDQLAYKMERFQAQG